MIILTVICVVGFAVMSFLLYRGLGILVEDSKLTRLLLQVQHKELLELIKNFNTDFNFVMGGELGSNLKKYLQKLDKDYTIVNGKVAKVDHDY